MWIIIETEDFTNLIVVKDEADCTAMFETEEEAQDYADRHCLDGQVVFIEE